LCRRQIDLGIAPAGQQRTWLEHQITDPDGGRQWAVPPAVQRPQPSAEHLERYRFDHVIVGTGIETCHNSFRLSACGQHQDRQIDALGSECSCQINAVPVGERYVDDDGLEVSSHRPSKTGCIRISMVDAVSVFLETLLQEPGEYPIVLYEK
jgi:hypothetical protein